MKTGKTIQELAAEIARQRDSMRDFAAPIEKIAMVAGGGLQLGANGGALAFPVNNLAHGQIAEYVGIPKPYYDRCLSEAPEVLKGQVNHWLTHPTIEQQKDPIRQVRTLDGRVRAFLSNRYRALGNQELAEAVFPVLAEAELEIVSCEITERRMYIKAFDKRVCREIERQGTDGGHTFIKRGLDTCYPAVCISNSEVGYGTLSVAASVFTGGCTNFAIFHSEGVRKYHLGGKVATGEEVYHLLTDNTKELTDAAVWAQVRDVTKAAFEGARFDALVARMSDATADRIPAAAVGEVVELVGRDFSFSKEERKSVLAHLIEGGDLSRYGLFNAVTRTAADLESYDRATEFETAGAKVIELPRNQWEKFAKAA